MKNKKVIILIVSIVIALSTYLLYQLYAEYKEQKRQTALIYSAEQLYYEELDGILRKYDDFAVEYGLQTNWHELFARPDGELQVHVRCNTQPNYEALFNMMQEIEKINIDEPRLVVSEGFSFNDSSCYISEDYLLYVAGESVYNSIAAKEGVNLTSKEKKSICEWIKRRYSYYDDKEGKYSGDKYSDIIFEEASSYFKVNPQDLDIIWMNYYSY